MNIIHIFINGAKASGHKVLGIDPGSGGDILVMGELLGGDMEADALLISQKYAGRLKKLCRGIFSGTIDHSERYDYILPGGYINHYPYVDSLIKTMGKLLNPDGHIYVNYSNKHVFDRVSNLFALGSGKMLKVNEFERKPRSYIEFDEFMRELMSNGLILCNMELTKALDVLQLEKNIRRFTENNDFILTVLDKVRYEDFELDICRC